MCCDLPSALRHGADIRFRDADGSFVPRSVSSTALKFCSCSEWQVRRAAPQHLVGSVDGSSELIVLKKLVLSVTLQQGIILHPFVRAPLMAVK